MKPRNEKEINNAFVQWILLFSLVVFFVIIAVFFDYGFPWKDYKTLKTEVGNVRTMNKSRQDFINKLDSINVWIKQYDDPTRVQNVIENDVSTFIVELKSTQGDSGVIKFNRSLSKTIELLLKTKQNLYKRDFSSKKLENENAELSEQLKNMKEDLKETRDELKELKTSAKSSE